MRAILLAAGMGTRLRPLTLDTPKSLIEVNGRPLLERQIEFLRERGVEEIIVVTGYLAEKFDYLKDKYGVKLVNNDKYDIYNNIYTMYLVREYLEKTYVVDADVYISENFLLEK
ncbi:MAG: NTP transferase domain-containing protein, partial [Clostridium perfringens]